MALTGVAARVKCCVRQSWVVDGFSGRQLWLCYLWSESRLVFILWDWYNMLPVPCEVGLYYHTCAEYINLHSLLTSVANRISHSYYPYLPKYLKIQAQPSQPSSHNSPHPPNHLTILPPLHPPFHNKPHRKSNPLFLYFITPHHIVVTTSPTQPLQPLHPHPPTPAARKNPPPGHTISRPRPPSNIAYYREGAPPHDTLTSSSHPFHLF